jgi:ABC-type amino acid transport substrate-binding protein
MRGFVATIVFIALFSSPLSAKELTGTLQQIQKSGKIKIGYRQSQPPMSFVDKDGKPAGYSIDICGHIVSEIKKKIGGNVDAEYVAVTASERFDALSNNRIDILCGATTKTLARSELVDFTQLTFITGASFMTLKNKDIRNKFDGKKIGVVKGTTTEVALKELFSDTQINAEVVMLNTTAEGVEGLEKEELDALSADQVVLIGLALATKNPNNFTVLPDLFSYEPFALALRRNDADFRLIADRVISNLSRSKELRTIYDKWLGRFSPQRPSAFEALIDLNAIPEE